MIEVIVVPTSEEVGTIAASVVATRVIERPDLVLGLATGASPQTLYARLAQRHRDGELTFAGISAFALDEYVGLPAGHPEGYRAVLHRDVVEPLHMDPRRVRVPAGTDPEAVATQYERDIAAAGGIDLQILGIGANGHIGFNEPGSSASTRTRVVELSDRTRRDNSQYFGGAIADVPTHAISQGIGTILEAGELLLVAVGDAKAQAVAAALVDEITDDLPASHVQTHARATFVLDEPAARLLPDTIRSPRRPVTAPS